MNLKGLAIKEIIYASYVAFAQPRVRGIEEEAHVFSYSVGTSQSFYRGQMRLISSLYPSPDGIMI